MLSPAVQTFAAPYMLSPGAIVAGKYRVERVIGEGGMGVVIAATHVALDQRVALKILRLASADRPDVVERFLREARNAVRLRSQHVAKVLDVGTLDSGLPFIVLEYLEGADLDGILRSQGPLAPDRATALVLQACEAVAEAHALGIVHRDLKPHNLFLTTGVGGSDLVKVLDFGIAKSESFAGGLTRSDSSVGSPLYMSPEQMRSPRDVDLRTDIWSLGVTLYELIAGRPPFDAESFPALVLKVQEGMVVPLRTTRPGVPDALSAALDRCLQSDPSNRFSNVGELATALEPFGGPDARASAENVRRALGHAPSTPKLAAANATGLASSGPKAWTESVASGVPSPKPKRDRRAVAIAGGAAVLLAVAIGVAVVTVVRSRSGSVLAPVASAAPPPPPSQSPSWSPSVAVEMPVATASAPAPAAPRASSSAREPRVSPPSPQPQRRRPVPVDDIPAER